ncbi:MAG: cation transporter [Dysgonamonadaceae bacterium]|jgi:copper chaperone CopZ|nr:cation transporter [Dysgonamonadaceae bacterium]
MKTKTVFMLIICSVMMISNIQVISAQNDTKEKKDNKEIVEFYVAGMHCKNCQKKIEKNIAFEKGVIDLNVDLENKIVTITFSKDKTNIEKLQKAFEKIGYATEIIDEEEKERKIN